MYEYAQQRFSLNTIQPDGASLRAHLQSTLRNPLSPAQQKAEAEALLEPVECPDEVLYLLDYFDELCIRRQLTGGLTGGVTTLSWGDIEAWSRLTATRLEAWEVGALNGLEAVYFQHVKEQRELLEAAAKGN